MWRFIGLLSLLILPFAIEAGDDPGPIKPCPENIVCVIFVEDTCKRGTLEKHTPAGIIWDAKTKCVTGRNLDLCARLEIEVHDPQTWTIVVTVQGQPDSLLRNKFVFDSSELTFSGPFPPIAEFKIKGESESTKIAIQVLEPEYVAPGLHVPIWDKYVDLWRYKFILSSHGEQKLFDLIGDTVTNVFDSETTDRHRYDGEYGKVDAGEGFAELLKEKSAAAAAAAAAATTQASDPANPNPKGPGTDHPETATDTAAQAKSSIGLIVGGVAGGLFLLTGVVVLLFIVWRRRKRNREINTERPSELPSRTGIDETTFSKKASTTTRDTTYENISSRKEGFSMDAPSFTGADVPSTNVAAGKKRKPGASKNVLSDVPSTTVTTGIEKSIA